MRDTPELLHCPCCDGPPQYATGISGVRFQVYVYCCHCPMRTEIVGGYEAAAAVWNKRVSLDAAEQRGRQEREAEIVGWLRTAAAECGAYSGNSFTIAADKIERGAGRKETT